MSGFSLYGGEVVEMERAEAATVFNSNAAEGVAHFHAEISAEMAAYDRLPPRIQRWLDQGPRKYSAVQILNLYRDGHYIDTSDLG